MRKCGSISILLVAMVAVAAVAMIRPIIRMMWTIPPVAARITQASLKHPMDRLATGLP
jgi:hypothetical protein